MMKVIVLWMIVVVLAACGSSSMPAAEVEKTAVPLREGERVYLTGSGPTEEAPVMRLNIRVRDAKSGAPVAADIWLDEQQIGDEESSLIVLLPGQFEGILTVRAQGYKEFSTGIRYTIKRSRTMDAPVKLEREVGQAA